MLCEKKRKKVRSLWRLLLLRYDLGKLYEPRKNHLSPQRIQLPTAALMCSFLGHANQSALVQDFFCNHKQTKQLTGKSIMSLVEVIRLKTSKSTTCFSTTLPETENTQRDNNSYLKFQSLSAFIITEAH